MFNTITPEKAGISSKYVTKFIKSLERNGLATHSFLMMRGNDIFAEYYWKPFDKDFCHRMYSQTKSFVGVVIGLLEEDGKLSLNDKISDHFPEKIDRELPSYLKNMSVKDMLTMQTCGYTPHWFYREDIDRTHLYFAENKATVPSGMRFAYDSPGSQVLTCLVEKLAGISLFDFLNERIFKHLGTFKTASILKTRNDDSFGDSALLCTTRDIASFARFVMNYGMWNGERLMNEDYLKKATSRIVDNNRVGFEKIFSQGYGYQIWRTEQNGFAFNGMGCQLTICLPDKDFIFTCTADNQGYVEAKALILNSLFELIVDNLHESPLPENPDAFKELGILGNSLELVSVKGIDNPTFEKELSGKTYICEDNPTGIKQFRFEFDSDNTGRLCYTNAQGDKIIYFGVNKNSFGKFPEYGYSNLHAGLKTNDGFLYDCASSAAWREEKKLLLKIQVIDKYFGNMYAIFSFKNDYATVTMQKNAEAFMDEYQGEFVARLKS